MEVIKDGNDVLAKILYEDDFHKSQFISENEDPLQVGVFINPAGAEIVNHVHNIFSRETLVTQEMIYVVAGALKARIYTSEKVLVSEKVLKAPSMIYLVSGGHGFTVLEDNTIFFEAKNGPYYGVEKDKVKFYD